MTTIKDLESAAPELSWTEAKVGVEIWYGVPMLDGVMYYQSDRIPAGDIVRNARRMASANSVVQGESK